METSKQNVDKDMVFNSKALRLTVGGIAFALPWVVIFATLSVTSSISASYHTKVRDIFVGALFVIGALLVAYNGHHVELRDENIGRFWNWLSQFWKDAKDFRKLERKYEERAVSFVGGLAAVIAALFPTACDLCEADMKSRIHVIAAAILFSAVVYFCLVGFMDQARAGKGSKAKLRVAIYWVCGWGIAAIMVGSVIAPYALTVDGARAWSITFWAETFALWLFGVAWATASKFLRFLVDDESEQFKIMDVKANKAKGKRQEAQPST
jgi:hypothetical protein